ncbi:Cell division protein ZapA-like protein [Candidatus Thiomargarita nelsonii]|uniref:Cell division protein ZapA n=1 Tax=Candidatus Thiomargarita nelsonii TaxID=1003181 RepID=A0A0A6NZA0_9GAMM|nr:Cell division protein ZapA-like protein [Candidatus Thiomargarita nelsonii]
MTLGKSSVPVNLHILDKEYVVACPEEERDTLMASAQYLNEKVKEVRNGGKVISTERLLVISALNIIHEYLHYKQEKEQHRDTFNNEIARLQKKIDMALLEVNNST